MTESGEVNRRAAWLMAARVHTLPAAAAPVLVGTGLAVHEGVFAFWPAIAAVVGAILIQLGTNLANDYYDADKGVDSAVREGFTRVTAGGLIPAQRVKFAMAATFGSALIVGLYLVYVGGVPILVIGLASIAAGILYTGGPYPFGYYGLGDLFVFVFFGVVAVTGTYYVQAVATLPTIPLWVPPGTLTSEAVIASLPMAALITDILVVNNVRDRESDAAAGKRTLAVLIGYRWSRVEFVGFVGLAYLVPVWFWLAREFSLLVLLPWITLPYAARITRTILSRTDGEALNPALERTGRLTAAFAGLFAVGLAV